MNDKTETKEDVETSDVQDKDSAEEECDEIGLCNEIDQFVSQIDGLANTVYFTMQMSSKAGEILDERRTKLLEEHGTPIVDEDGDDAYQVPAKHVKEVRGVTRKLRHLDVGMATLPKTHLIALISAYDYFLGRLLRWYFLKTPAALRGSDRQISLRELLAFGSIETAQDYFVEKEIDTFLRNSHSDQIKTLEKMIDRPLTKGLEVWPEFIEITERRNLFTHADGHVSEQYLRVCKNHGCTTDDELKVGDVLSVPPKYFTRAADVVFQMGVMLGQTFGRVICPDDMPDLDQDLNNLSVDLMTDERFELAKSLLDFALRFPKHSAEEFRLRAVINRAQAQKWLGDQAGCDSTLDDEDWTATSRPFKLCVAVLKDQYDKASSLMQQLGVDSEITEYDYVNWPIFRDFRDTDQFAKAFELVFGKEPSDRVSSDEKEDSDTKDTVVAPNATKH